MAAQTYVDYSGLSFNAEEARTSADLVFEDVWVKPDMLTQVHAVETGIKMNKQIPILGQYGQLGKLDPGDCTSNTSTAQVPSTEKFWTPKPISFRLEDCEAKIPQERKFWEKKGDWKDRWEDQSSEEMAFVTERVVDATYESILRIADFGDTDASPVGDATGNEKLTVGTEKTLYNMLDGMWKQIFTDQAGAKATFRTTITENGQATKALQMVLAETTAYDAMKALYNGIDSRARKSGGLVYQATESLFSNYLDYLETKSLNFTLDEVLLGGVKLQRLTYRKIQMIERSDWTRQIETYHDNGTTYYLPHRMILTPLENIPVGTSDTNSMESVNSNYDAYKKIHFMDVAYNLDMKIILEYAMAEAY